MVPRRVTCGPASQANSREVEFPNAHDKSGSGQKRPVPELTVVVVSHGGTVGAARELPWVLRHRRRLPAEAEAAVAALEISATSSQRSNQSKGFH
jgi:hypothetical protein